ncbi:dehydrogenase [Chengkuizengella sediminis]|uniref:dehydrogenase n=1 Tax=Chengkuizengella sediminis TaxID=1885917 RepID=UPI001389B7E1|nr:dehydrogenase [Chengkuizengella sediminis]NDI36092.1 dehydrogenase [Chengkuizengella sediminis]
MKHQDSQKHNLDLPTARKIRRACNKEIYRTIKRLNTWIPPEKIKEAEELYYKKVLINSKYILENAQNRKLLSDWFDENVCAEFSILWGIEESKISKAFRNAFVGQKK